MGINTEFGLKIRKCAACGKVAGVSKHIYQTFREWDGDICLATMVDLICKACGNTTSIQDKK